MLAPLYLGLKTAAYVTWCWFGIGSHPRRSPAALSGSQRLRRAFGFGLFRAALGLGFGVGIWLLSSMLAGALGGGSGLAAQIAVYLAVYVPVRVVEWGVVSALMLGTLSSRFIAGGIGVSVALDMPMVVALGGLPLGRFMC